MPCFTQQRPRTRGVSGLRPSTRTSRRRSSRATAGASARAGRNDAAFASSRDQRLLGNVVAPTSPLVAHPRQGSSTPSSSTTPRLRLDRRRGASTSRVARARSRGRRSWVPSATTRPSSSSTTPIGQLRSSAGRWAMMIVRPSLHDLGQRGPRISCLLRRIDRRRPAVVEDQNHAPDRRANRAARRSRCAAADHTRERVAVLAR